MLRSISDQFAPIIYFHDKEFGPFESLTMFVDEGECANGRYVQYMLQSAAAATQSTIVIYFDPKSNPVSVSLSRPNGRCKPDFAKFDVDEIEWHPIVKRPMFYAALKSHTLYPKPGIHRRGWFGLRHDDCNSNHKRWERPLSR